MAHGTKENGSVLHFAPDGGESSSDLLRARDMDPNIWTSFLMLKLSKKMNISAILTASPK